MGLSLEAASLEAIADLLLLLFCLRRETPAHSEAGKWQKHCEFLQAEVSRKGRRFNSRL